MLRDRYPNPIAELRRDFLQRCLVPAAHEHRGDRSHIRVKASGNASLKASHICIGGADIIVAREQQRDVDRYTGEDGLLDGRETLESPRYLNEKIGTLGLSVQCARVGHRLRRIMRKQR